MFIVNSVYFSTGWEPHKQNRDSVCIHVYACVWIYIRVWSSECMHLWNVVCLLDSAEGRGQGQIIVNKAEGPVLQHNEDGGQVIRSDTNNWRETSVSYLTMSHGKPHILCRKPHIKHCISFSPSGLNSRCCIITWNDKWQTSKTKKSVIIGFEYFHKKV